MVRLGVVQHECEATAVGTCHCGELEILTTTMRDCDMLDYTAIDGSRPDRTIGSPHLLALSKSMTTLSATSSAGELNEDQGEKNQAITWYRFRGEGGAKSCSIATPQRLSATCTRWSDDLLTDILDFVVFVLGGP